MSQYIYSLFSYYFTKKFLLRNKIKIIYIYIYIQFFLTILYIKLKTNENSCSIIYKFAMANIYTFCLFEYNLYKLK